VNTSFHQTQPAKCPCSSLNASWSFTQDHLRGSDNGELSRLTDYKGSGPKVTPHLKFRIPLSEGTNLLGWLRVLIAAFISATSIRGR